MEIQWFVKHGNIIVVLAGELDLRVANTLRQQLDEVLEHAETRQIILDMEAVTFIDSSGIGVILGRYKRLLALHGSLRIWKLQPQVERVLTLAGIVKLIPVCRNEQEVFACG